MQNSQGSAALHASHNPSVVGKATTHSYDGGVDTRAGMLVADVALEPGLTHL